MVIVADCAEAWRVGRILFALLTLTGGWSLIPKSLGFIFSVEAGVVEHVPSPTTRELEILKVLWDMGQASVRAVHRALASAEDIAYNTVQTLLRIMERKGLVRHHVEGRTFVYTPCFSRDESAARFLDRVFDGAASELVLSLLRAERIPPRELEQMQTMIATARRRRR
jgi:BlaI family transcriptional regulator, penicillinase repressor